MNSNKDIQGQPQLSPKDPIRISPMKTVIDRLKLSFMIFVIYLILNLLHFGCPIKGFTGISCPGCGMTRATISALLLHFKDAFYFHPLFPITPIMFLLFLFDGYVPVKIKKTAWIIIILLFLFVYFYRLFFTENAVVSIDIWSGLVLKLLHNIIA